MVGAVTVPEFNFVKVCPEALENVSSWPVNLEAHLTERHLASKGKYLQSHTFPPFLGKNVRHRLFWMIGFSGQKLSKRREKLKGS